MNENDILNLIRSKENSSSVGSITTSNSANSSTKSLDELTSTNSLINQTQNCIQIIFKSNLSDHKEIEWKTYLYNKHSLYVHIPSSNATSNVVFSDGSRDSFVSLLEFAEEQLGCANVFIWFNKNRVDRQSLMRAFMFLGFKVVSPGNNKIAIQQSDDTIIMVYEIDK